MKATVWKRYVVFGLLWTVWAMPDAIAAEAFEFRAPAVAITFNPADGVAPFQFCVSIEEQGLPLGTPAQAFALGMAYDPTLISIDGAVPCGSVASLQAGAGPDYFGVGLQGSGVTIGCVFAFDMAETLTFFGPTEVVEFSGQAVPAALLGQVGTVLVGLSFVNTLGAPPVVNSVVVNLVEIAPMLTGGELQFSPALNLPFIRGDLDGSGHLNLADVIQIFLFVFGGVGGGCLDSLDVNDDGAVDVSDGVFELSFIFGGGVSPSLPFPACGADGTADLLDCGTAMFCP